VTVYHQAQPPCAQLVDCLALPPLAGVPAEGVPGNGVGPSRP